MRDSAYAGRVHFCPVGGLQAGNLNRYGRLQLASEQRRIPLCSFSSVGDPENEHLLTPKYSEFLAKRQSAAWLWGAAPAFACGLILQAALW